MKELVARDFLETLLTVPDRLAHLEKVLEDRLTQFEKRISDRISKIEKSLDRLLNNSQLHKEHRIKTKPVVESPARSKIEYPTDLMLKRAVRSVTPEEGARIRNELTGLVGEKRKQQILKLSAELGVTLRQVQSASAWNSGKLRGLLRLKS